MPPGLREARGIAAGGNATHPGNIRGTTEEREQIAASAVSFQWAEWSTGGAASIAPMPPI
jgi:hypothetical protein